MILNYPYFIVLKLIVKILYFTCRIAKTIKNAVQSSGKQDAITKLKRVLGVTPHDESLVNYWSKAYC